MGNVKDALHSLPIKVVCIFGEDNARLVEIDQLARLRTKGIKLVFQLETSLHSSFTKQKAIISKEEARDLCRSWCDFNLQTSLGIQSLSMQSFCENIHTNDK